MRRQDSNRIRKCEDRLTELHCETRLQPSGTEKQHPIHESCDPTELDTPDLRFPKSNICEILRRPWNTAPLRPAAFDVEAIGDFLRLGCGTSGDAHGVDRIRRVAASSGNLQAVNYHIVLLKPVGGVQAGVYRYSPEEHALCGKLDISNRVSAFSDADFFVLLSVKLTRQTSKYGARGVRYALLDVGHGVSAVRNSSSVLGWNAELLPVSDSTLALLVGHDPEAWYAEFPVLLVAIHAGPTPSPWLRRDINRRADGTATADGIRRANSRAFAYSELSELDRFSASVFALTDKEGFERVSGPPRTAPRNQSNNRPTVTAIWGRRTPRDFDTDCEISRPTFERLATSVRGRVSFAERKAVLNSSTVPVFFAHRVRNLARGIYAFPEDVTRRSISDQPDDSMLVCLLAADTREDCWFLTCFQRKAEACAFATLICGCHLDVTGAVPSRYREVYLEAGIRAHTLGVESVEHGLQTSSIGAFYDDEVVRYLADKTGIRLAPIMWTATGVSHRLG